MKAADFTLQPERIGLADGRVVRLRRLSALERADYLGNCSDASKAVADKSQRERLVAALTLAGDLIALTLIDEDGQRLFASGAEAAGAMDSGLLEEIGGLAAKLNRIGADDPNA